MQSATQLTTGISASTSSVTPGEIAIGRRRQHEHADQLHGGGECSRRCDLAGRERERRDRPALELADPVEVAAEVAGQVVAHQKRQERDEEDAGATHLDREPGNVGSDQRKRDRGARHDRHDREQQQDAARIAHELLDLPPRDRARAREVREHRHAARRRRARPPRTRPRSCACARSAARGARCAGSPPRGRARRARTCARPRRRGSRPRGSRRRATRSAWVPRSSARTAARARRSPRARATRGRTRGSRARCARSARRARPAAGAR